MHFRTRAIHVGNERDPATGAVVRPIHLTSTFVQPGAGEWGEFAQIGPDNKVEVRPVMATERVGTEWIIQSKELKAGDRVVAEGVQKVRDGMVVNPMPLGSANKARAESPGVKPESKKE